MQQFNRNSKRNPQISITKATAFKKLEEKFNERIQEFTRKFNQRDIIGVKSRSRSIS